MDQADCHCRSHSSLDSTSLVVLPDWRWTFWTQFLSLTLCKFVAHSFVICFIASHPFWQCDAMIWRTFYFARYSIYHWLDEVDICYINMFCNLQYLREVVCQKYKSQFEFVKRRFMYKLLFLVCFSGHGAVRVAHEIGLRDIRQWRLRNSHKPNNPRSTQNVSPQICSLHA